MLWLWGVWVGVVIDGWGVCVLVRVVVCGGGVLGGGVCLWCCVWSGCCVCEVSDGLVVDVGVVLWFEWCGLVCGVCGCGWCGVCELLCGWWVGLCVCVCVGCGWWCFCGRRCGGGC
jgi:hypothetical protein